MEDSKPKIQEESHEGKTKFLQKEHKEIKTHKTTPVVLHIKIYDKL